MLSWSRLDSGDFTVPTAVYARPSQLLLTYSLSPGPVCLPDAWEILSPDVPPVLSPSPPPASFLLCPPIRKPSCLESFAWFFCPPSWIPVLCVVFPFLSKYLLSCWLPFLHQAFNLLNFLQFSTPPPPQKRGPVLSGSHGSLLASLPQSPFPSLDLCM